MSFLAIATDYDGTLAANGHADEQAVAALRSWRSNGRRLLLITGRERESLLSVCPGLDLFDLVVAENGAVLYFPGTETERPLAGAPPKDLIQRLRQLGVQPLTIGRCIIATLVSHEPTVLRAIRDLRLPWTVTRNRESLMALPAGVDKGTGLAAALAELSIQKESAIGIGDAENDHAFMSMCGYAVAVANAVPAIKRQADLVTSGAFGLGVVEAVHHLLSSPAIHKR